MGQPAECIGGELLMADNGSAILMADYLVTDTELTSVADAIREKGGTTEPLSFPEGFVSAVESIQAGASEPALQEKTATPTTAQQEITPDSGYDGLSKVTISAVKTAVQATPEMKLSSRSAQVIATVTQEEGYVAAGTKSATIKLNSQATKTVTPGTVAKTAVEAGRYTTGRVTVQGDANLVAWNIKSGVSIFGVAGSLDPGSSKGVKYTSINETKSVSVDYGGYVKIDVSSSVVAECPNIIYAEGTTPGGDTVRFVRTGDGNFYGSEYSSDEQGFYDTSVQIFETTNADGSKSWEWLIDPSGAGPDTITIKTIVMGA